LDESGASDRGSEREVLRQEPAETWKGFLVLCWCFLLPVVLCLVSVLFVGLCLIRLARRMSEIGTLGVAKFDFEGLRDDNLPFQAGDVITIIEMNDNGWWKGSDSKGRVGIFPYNYVELREDVGDSFPVLRALFDYRKVNEGDIEFKKGDLITLMRELSEDWYEGIHKKSGSKGTFPANHVERTDLEDVELAKEEKKKWKKIEEEKRKEAEAAAKEKAEIEKRIAEERKAREKKKAEEQAKKAEQEERERLMREAREAAERARKAEEELERIRAETARLKRQEEARKARKSLRASKRLAKEYGEIKAKAENTAMKFEGFSPGPAPEQRVVDPDDDDFFGSAADAPPMVTRGTVLANYDDKKEQQEEEEEEEEVEPERDTEKKFAYNKKFAKLGGGEKCKVCGKSVGYAEKVKAANAIYHKDCFRCSTCSNLLMGGQFREHKGHVYCEKCHAQGFGIKGFGFGGAAVPVAAPGKSQGQVDDGSVFDVLKK